MILEPGHRQLIELEEILLRQDAKNILEKKTNKRIIHVHATVEKTKKGRMLKENVNKTKTIST